MSKNIMQRIQHYANNGWEINVQIWGDGENNIYVSKGDVDMWSDGGCETMEKALESALHYLDRVNNKS